jgi:signal transduction histidine kinase
MRREMRELVTLLALSGVAGLAICLATTYLTTRWIWRRHAQLSATAALVAAGRLDVRAPVRAAAAAAPDEIDELSIAFNAMLDQIVRLVDQLRRVSRDVAHDMRRPMTRLRQKLDRVARSAQATPTLRAEVARLDAEFCEILRTFDALLQLAEIEGRPRPDAPVDLGDVAEKVLDALRPDIESGGRTLAAHVQRAEVKGDRDLIAQALVNILENAAQHTPPGARIELRVDADPAPRVLVRDDGPGIPADQRDTALAPLGRLEASRSSPGAGLGLAIAASVAVRHGAQLELGDAHPGLQVSMSFPRAGARPAA